MTFTGYIIKWREVSGKTNHWPHSMVVGNITTTTIRGLSPNTTYVFGIGGLNEDQNDELCIKLDLYGRRNMLDDAIEGSFETITGHTLTHDVWFQRFDANSTQNHGPVVQNSSLGPTGIETGEGHYGLVLVGHANIENCNSSSFCCDSYNKTTGRCNDVDSNHICLESLSLKEVVHKIVARKELDRVLPGNGKIVERYNESSSLIRHGNLFDSPCGPALRLTASKSRQVGAAWYPRQVELGEGFEANFTFRISNPSLR